MMEVFILFHCARYYNIISAEGGGGDVMSW